MVPLGIWVIFGVGMVILVVALIYYICREDKAKAERQAQKERERQAFITANVDDMTGTKFELWCVEMFRFYGYTNIQTTSTSGDYGADIIADTADGRWAIQCKRSNNKIGVSAIQEVAAARAHYGCKFAAVVTNNYFTANAVKLAAENNVSLYDRSTLRNYMMQLNGKP